MRRLASLVVSSFVALPVLAQPVEKQTVVTVTAPEMDGAILSEIA